MNSLPHLIKFLFLVLTLLNTISCITRHKCLPNQKAALLELKSEFEKDDSVFCSYPKTESWVDNSDCCSWDGITCHSKSGHVVGLDLGSSCLHGHLNVNSSLFRLHHLRELNLSLNNFSGSSISTEFDKLISLERLNLSNSFFLGEIPINLLKLTNLVSLDLSSRYTSEFTLSSSFTPLYPQTFLSIDKSFLLQVTQNLRKLRDLDMSFVKISLKIPHEFSTMWSLRSLHLESCNLNGEFPSNILLIPNLEFINLDDNPNLRGNLPSFQRNNSMKFLSLSTTSFSGRIPSSIGNLSHLTHLQLAYNNFIGEIPSSVGNLRRLTYFDVRRNKLTGDFPSALLNLTQLRIINLNHNHFTNFLPSNISQLSKLKGFSVMDNSFIGGIPSSLYKISSLMIIALGQNNLNNLVGIENISMLHDLVCLDLGNNNFMVSPVDLNVFSPLKNLGALSLSHIPLSLTNITYDWGLTLVEFSSCNITEFPDFIRYQKSLSYLDLSSNKIKGHIPNWLWKLELSTLDLSNNSLSSFGGSLEYVPISQIQSLDLSSNAFQGPIFIPSIYIQNYMVSENNFTGEIPRSICELSSLVNLDLSKNNLHGSIPRCLGDHITSSLADLNLHKNRLQGSIPDIFGKAKRLQFLDISHNKLVGKLPTSLVSCSSLEVLNVGNNQIRDTFPFWLHSLPTLQVLVLRSNEFHGVLQHPKVEFPQLRIIDVSLNDFTGSLSSDYFINLKAMHNTGDDAELEYMQSFGYYYDSLILMSKGVEREMTRILKIFTAIDLSGNQLHGMIPESIGLLKGLYVLNLSSNGFTGKIPSSLEYLTKLESLDLSQNKISGEIPPQLGNLYSLAWINVSHNHLVGSIPQGTQFQRQNCSSYEGNPGLNEYSLKDVCGVVQSSEPAEPGEEGEDGEDEKEKSVFWIAAGYAFAPGVILGLVIGFMTVSYRLEWFIKIFTMRKQRTRVNP